MNRLDEALGGAGGQPAVDRSASGRTYRRVSPEAFAAEARIKWA